MGFRARLEHPPYVMEVDCPLVQADDGSPYKKFTLFQDILPGENTALNCYLKPSRRDEFAPGHYTIALLKEHEAVHEEKSELTP